MSRIDSLKALVDQNPQESRFRYMLAIESVNEGDLAGAAQIFEEILARDPGYSAAYFHGGRTLEKLGRTGDAREIYRRGIEVTRASGEDHARGELEGALAMLG